MSGHHFDVVIVGAGISGIDAAYRLQELCPSKTYTVLEGRDALGGTWDLFKYPGIRSDSDLHTFGFAFNPWPHDDAIAEGPLVINYLRDTVQKFGIDNHIRYRHKVETADWSDKRQTWTLDVAADGGSNESMTCQYLFFCTGYYDYQTPLSATIPGLSDFKGTVVHPQFWPDDFSVKDKNVVIIGSGATAITLLPSIAEQTSHVTMLQRSPSWVISVPKNDAVSRWMRAWLPAVWQARLFRLRFSLISYFSYNFFRTFPKLARNFLSKAAKDQLPDGYPLDPNFNPRYNPWDQRLCVCPDGDFYKAIKKGTATIVTGEIENVDATTIRIKDSKVTLSPDVIVTATGLKIKVGGGVRMTVNGSPVDVGKTYLYRHAMLSGVPNMATFIGYVNASWTPGSDCTAHMMCRLIKHNDSHGYASATPAVRGHLEDAPVLKMNSTYIKAAAGDMPQCGNRGPWKPRNWYLADLYEAKYADWREVDFTRASGASLDEKEKEL